MRFKDMVIYQIYPKSFKDTTGSGIGDLRGIITKLDYLKGLGVDMIWISPFYPSPQHDNGYDVSDYKAIDPLYGTMADFEDLIEEAGKREIGIMMDMILNHCSTVHAWFQKALSGDKYYQDFFYLRPGRKGGSLPTNWASKFGGPAWERFGDSDLYYLHLYDVHQADLNWHNPNVRKELYDIVNFWLDKGVKGLRFDVLNVIGKDENLVDSKLPGSNHEKSLYTDTPIVHEWVKELKENTFGRYKDIITVGEMSSTDISNGIKYTNSTDGSLSMIFNFHHLKADYKQGDKWTNAPVDFKFLKNTLHSWQEGMTKGDGWNALFWNNHDQPRANDRFGDTKNYPYETATMLAQTIHLLRGTPYIYQGEEFGMTDPDFKDISQYRDIESINHYNILLNQGLSEAETLEIIAKKSRDNARTPMQWNSGNNAGFSDVKPWIELANNYKDVNVESDINKDKSIFKYYQQLIQLRKDYKVISDGDYRGILLDHPKLFAYIRSLEDEELLVINNFFAEDVKITIPDEYVKRQSYKLIGNGCIKELTKNITLAPYETIAFLFE